MKRASIVGELDGFKVTVGPRNIKQALPPVVPTPRNTLFLSHLVAVSRRRDKPCHPERVDVPSTFLLILGTFKELFV